MQQDSDYPSKGAITLLMTDIEGSTRHWEECGDQFIPTLMEHNRLVRESLADLGGQEIKTEGDSFFFTFPSAIDAITGAVSIQQRIIEQDLGVQIRIGIHTGEPAFRDNDYFGPVVNRANRVCDAAHGGQILVSSATHALTAELLPDDVTLVDFGEHRLRDLGSPERLFQVAHPNLPQSFPPLRTLEVQPNNLPAQPTSFVGRKNELKALMEILIGRSARLVTVTGAGGVGKTRLALQTAAECVDEFPGGVWYVSLASITEELQALPQIATTILGEVAVVREPFQALVRFLFDKRALLILDGFESVLPAAHIVSDLLLALPRLACLVTSRSLLQIAGEHEFQTPSLSPDESLALLVERGHAAKPGLQMTSDSYTAAVKVCSRLDGLPLAIELAAARLRGLTMSQIAQRLVKRFDLLSGGGKDMPDRQRTVRAALDWSYQPLPPDESALFAQLSVFSGGFFLDAAENICDVGDVLEGVFALRDSSLLSTQEAFGETRFLMLSLVREYAEEKLADPAPIRRRHAEYYLDFAQKWCAQIYGVDQKLALARLDMEYPNCEAAVRWAHDAGEWRLFAGFVSALGEYAHSRGFISPQTTEMMRHAIECVRQSGDTESLAALMLGMGAIAWMHRRFDEAVVMLTTSLKYFRASGESSAACRALNLLGLIASDDGSQQDANSHLQEGLDIARSAGLVREQALLLQNLSLVLLRDQDFEAARARAEECLNLNLALRDQTGASYQIHTLGVLAWKRSEWRRGAELLLEALTIREQMGDQPGMARSLRDCGLLLLDDGEVESAGSFILAAHALESLALISSSREDEAACTQLRDAIGDRSFEAISSSARERPVSEVISHLRGLLEASI